MIAIISNKQDISTDYVVREVRRRGLPYFRINTEDLAGFRCSVEFSPVRWSLHTSKGALLAENLNAILYRRPGNPFCEVPENKKPPLEEQRFIVEQWATWIEGLEHLPGIKWVNHPAIADRFENKIEQLRLAEEIGFRIPRTIVSNDPTLVRSFVKEGPSISKALFSPLLERTHDDLFVFTESIDIEHLGCDAQISAAPAIYQEAISPKTDFRVTVVGSYIFVARIEIPEGSLDWRVHKEAVKFIRSELPQAIRDKCFEFVRKAGLVFGAIDLVERSGVWYFLEINPSGEWGWLQLLGLPIAEAICDTLVTSSANE